MFHIAAFLGHPAIVDFLFGQTTDVCEDVNLIDTVKAVTVRTS